jgi:cyclohexadienyl dehydratase
MRGLLPVALAAALFSTAQSAEPSRLDAVRARGVIRIGTTGDYFPYTFRDLETGGFKGYDIEVAKALAQDMGVKLEFVQTTWPTLVAGLSAGKYDLAAAGITVTPERRQVADFSTAYLKPHFAPIIRRKDAERFKTLADIDQPGVTVVLQQGTATEDAGRRLFHKATLKSVLEPVVDYTEVLAGHADATFTDNLYFASSIQRRYPQLMIIEGPEDPEVETALMTVKGDAAWIGWINDWVKRRQESGFFDGLNRAWFAQAAASK